MLKSLYLFICVILLSACSVKQESVNADYTQVDVLAQDILSLNKKVSRKEAYHFAKEALTHPKVLAKSYDLVAPANYHNMLINLGYRTRGLCFHWSEDMMSHLKKQNYTTLDLRWGVSGKRGPDEHNSVIVVAKGEPFKTGIVIDPWRNSGNLYWSKIEDDEKFKWVEDMKRTNVLGTVQP